MKTGAISNDHGDAVMVTAVLLLSIFLSAGSNFLLEYGDVVGKDEDMTHAADIEDSLLRTRASMNSLLKAGDVQTVIFDRYTLGTFGTPYLAVARSSGTIGAVSDPSIFQFSMVLEDGAQETTINDVNGALTYQSNNYYYHDQDFHFTAGGVVLEQYGSQVMKFSPDIQIFEASGGLRIQLYLYSIISPHWRITGIESLPLSIRMAGSSHIERDIASGHLSLRINGVGERAWYEYLSNYLQGVGFIEGPDYVVAQPADWNDVNDHLEFDIFTINSLDAWIGEMEVTI